jgi:hypothetical protein
MRRVWILGVCFVLLSTAPVWAQNNVADRQTVFNDVTDWIATAGKPKAQKQRIVTQRRKSRREARLLKLRDKKSAQTQKTMQQQENNIMRKERAKEKARGY